MEDEGRISDHTAGIAATDGSWHHIAVSWSAHDGLATLYDNGHKVRFDPHHCKLQSIPAARGSTCRQPPSRKYGLPVLCNSSMRLYSGHGILADCLSFQEGEMGCVLYSCGQWCGLRARPCRQAAR